MPQLKIPDQVYNDAATAVWKIRRNAEPNVSLSKIEQEIRSYVDAGQKMLINDWSYQLSQDAKNAILGVVQKQTKSLYSFEPPLTDLTVTLNSMETQGAYGLVSTQITSPRRAQQIYAGQIEQAHAENPGFWDHVSNGIKNFFGFIGSGLASAGKGILSGLGISTPVLIAIGAALLFLLIAVLKHGPRLV